jgi:hypothetical protein
MNWQNTIFIILFIALPVCSGAQNIPAKHDVDIEIPEVALLGLSSENQVDIALNLTSPSEAGNELDLSHTKNTSVWINYSSIVQNHVHRRKVVAMIHGDIPEGMHLTVEASEALGYGNGKLGEPVGKVTLSEQPTDLIVNIGSCYTGRGSSNGHYLTYQLEQNNSENSIDRITYEAASVCVLYTLTDIN